MARERLRMDARRMWHGTAPLVAGARFLLFVATALWVPVLLLPGDTMRGSTAYDTIRALARWLGLPRMDGVLSPGELLLGAAALFLTCFSATDYALGGNRRSGARVYLASIFWIGLAASYILANPLAYGTWLFTGFAALSVWCLGRVRQGGQGGR